jgi:hypothetical protein
MNTVLLRLSVSTALFFMVGCTSDDVLEEGATPDECVDSIDNDENGLVDCEDEGCMDFDFCQVPPVAELRINEFMASNSITIEDSTGAFPDWVEIYNPTSEAISMVGLTITDDLTLPSQHVLGDLTIEPMGFLLLFADGDTEQGVNHVGFSLSKSGESLGLYAEDGTAIDELDYGQQASDFSAARVPDGSNTWEIVEMATPGTTNTP